jgi:K+-transporting ATPase KdpF subunit
MIDNHNHEGDYHQIDGDPNLYELIIIITTTLSVIAGLFIVLCYAILKPLQK